VCLACAKEILDRPMAMQQVLGCMSNTVKLASSVGIFPTDAEAEELAAATDAAAKVAGKIEKRLSREAGIRGGHSGEGG
jgi:hypothetical protein